MHCRWFVLGVNDSAGNGTVGCWGKCYLEEPQILRFIVLITPVETVDNPIHRGDTANVGVDRLCVQREGPC